MTLYIDESNLTVDFYINAANMPIGLYDFVITSQYSHQPISLVAALQNTNDRYSQYNVSFPIGFGNEHKNGVYYYSLAQVGQEPFTHGLVKIITEPGGGMGTIAYDSGIDAEERVADVFYRPNY